MCGIGITVGKNESPVPQAAHQLAKAILDDLEAADEMIKERRKGVATLDEVEEVSGKKKKTTGSRTMQDNVETSIRGRARKRAMGKWPLVKEDGSTKASEVAAEGSLDEQSEEFNEGGATILLAINTEERQDVSTCTTLQPHK